MGYHWTCAFLPLVLYAVPSFTPTVLMSQLGIQYIAQGYFDIIVRAGYPTNNLWVGKRPRRQSCVMITRLPDFIACDSLSFLWREIEATISTINQNSHHQVCKNQNAIVRRGATYDKHLLVCSLSWGKCHAVGRHLAAPLLCTWWIPSCTPDIWPACLTSHAPYNKYAETSHSSVQVWVSQLSCSFELRLIQS